MDTTNQLDLMLDALAEIIEEEKGGKAPTPPAPDLPTLGSVLAGIAPLPRGALFLGMANDGLPVLLDLRDPVPGPILLAGNAFSGKTRLLKTIARAADILFPPDVVQYGVVTAKPDEWKSLYGSENNAGIYRSNEQNAAELLQSLVTWAHNNKGEGQSILLFIDGLEDIAKLEEQARQNLRWLLLRGPSRRIWTFATLNANRAENLLEWLDFFRARLFGFVEDEQAAKFLTGDALLNHLSPGEEFALREGNRLLKFWLPTID